MRQVVKVSFSVFLVFLLATPYELLAQAQAQAKDPHTVFRFNEIPDPDYYSRDFVLNGLQPVRDATNIDSDQIIRDDPQSQRGFQAHWLLPSQAVAAVDKPTITTCVGGSGEVIRLTLREGEAVVYDTATQAILSIVRCANKCISGNINIPQREVVETFTIKEVEKPIFITKPQFEVVEKPVFIDRPVFTQTPAPVSRRTTVTKKRGWLLPLIIGGGAAGITAAILLAGDKNPRKTYPSARVLSPP